jgi:hypothetical protein
MAVNWNLDAERDLWAAICAPNRWHDTTDQVATHPDSLWWFVRIAWGAEWFFRSGERRWLTERVHRPYLKWLQGLRLEWVRRRREGRGVRFNIATIIPRGFGKTVTSTKAAPLWVHLDNPDMSSLLCSEVRDKAADFLSSIKKVMTGEDTNSWFVWLYGQWRHPERDWLKNSCVHAYRRAVGLSEPSFDTSGVDTGMTGYHPAECLWDDPLSANKLREGGAWLPAVHTAFGATFPALQTDGWLQMTLTRYLDDDIAGRALKEEGVCEWSGMEPPNMTYFEKIERGKGVWHVYFLQVEDQDGIPILPEVMDTAEIAWRRKRDPADFARQYMNDPGAGEQNPLTQEQLDAMRMDRAKLRSDLPIAYATIHLDTAFKSEDTISKGDESVIVTFLHDARPNGMVYFDSAHGSNEWRDEQFMDELVKVLLDLRRRHIWVKCITDEQEVGGKRGLFRNHLIATIRGAGLQLPSIIQFVRQGTQKNKRIRTAAGFWADGFVRLLVPKTDDGQWQDAAVPGFRKLVSQMLRIDVATHCDYSDAAADVWSEGVWRKPSFDNYLTSPDVGMPIYQAGDDALKTFGKPLSEEQVRTLYDDLFASDDLHGADDEWLPPRETV